MIRNCDILCCTNSKEFGAWAVSRACFFFYVCHGSLSDETRHLERVFFFERQLQRTLYQTQHSQKHWTWRDNQQLDSCHNNDYTLQQKYFWDCSTNLTTYDTYWPTSRTKPNLTIDRGRCTESSVLAVRLLILGRLAETWRQDWLNTNEPPRMVISSTN